MRAEDREAMSWDKGSVLPNFTALWIPSILKASVMLIPIQTGLNMLLCFVLSWFKPRISLALAFHNT